jgi:hypothetical protein
VFAGLDISDVALEGRTASSITRAGFKGIAGLSPESLAPRGVISDGAGGTLRGPPAQMFVYLFMTASSLLHACLD